MLTAFGDESHDVSCIRVFAVAGLAGRQEDWNTVEAAWQARTQGRVFHAAECESDTGEFTGNHKDNQKLYADLVNILVNSSLIGHAAVVSLEDYRNTFPSDFKDEPCYWCFCDVLRGLAEIAFFSVPQEQVEFTFDQHLEREFNATLLYDFAVNRSDSRLCPCMGNKVRFASRKLIGIQTADLVAREAMKNLDNQIGPVPRPIRLSMMALTKTKRFHFEYFRKIDFERLKRSIQDLAIPGSSLQAYRIWLAEQKRLDCTTNRIHYLYRVERDIRT